MKIILATPRGFCAGVRRAIAIVEAVLAQYGAPIYVHHEVVHNRFVIAGFQKKGVVFVEELSQIPSGSPVIFSAHGVAQAVRREAETSGLIIFDATCPLVEKVHRQVQRASSQEQAVVLVGHAGHAEVRGTLGQYEATPEKIRVVASVEDVKGLPDDWGTDISCVTQTTLAVEETEIILQVLKKRFPTIEQPRKSDICYATSNRQHAVKQLARKVDLVIVIGSQNSSNSRRLVEVVKHQGKAAYLIDSANELIDDWLTGIDAVGLTSGASAPEFIVESVIEALFQRGATVLEEQCGKKEHVTFLLPKNLRPSVGSVAPVDS